MTLARACCLVFALSATGTLLAQPLMRRVTTIETVRQFPGYYHLQNVLLRGEVVESNTQLVMRANDFDLALVNPALAAKGPIEVRGQVFDVGRLEREDSRLADYVTRRGSREWPRPGQEMAISITSATPSDPAVQPTVRALALEPWRFEGRPITVVGNFRGRNLFGDLPDAPGKGRYDFVLSGSEGAIWVTGIRPRGRGFDLDVERRIDSDKWLRLTGTVSRIRSLVVLTATEVALTAAPDLVSQAEEPAAPAPLLEPATVVFSVPTNGESDVARTATMRVQLSKGLRPESLAGHMRVTYTGERPVPVEFKTSYDPVLRVIQLTFARPLDQFRTVSVELLPGILAFDGAPVTPWGMTFGVGSN